MGDNKFLDQMEGLGFEWIGTGGGCDAYIMRNPEEGNGSAILVSDGEVSIPTAKGQTCLVGFYSDYDNNDVNDFVLTCKFGDILSGRVRLQSLVAWYKDR